MSITNNISSIVKTKITTKIEGFQNFGALGMNFNLRSDQKEIKRLVNAIDEIVSRAKEGDTVKTRQFELKGKFPPYRYAIIDLEGAPPKFFGIYYQE